jgi:small conductance mechanosensitive channel
VPVCDRHHTGERESVKDLSVRLFLQSRLSTAPASARELRQHAVERSRRAWRRIVLMLPLIAGVVALHRFREQLFGLDEPVRIATAVVLVVVGWAFASQLGSALSARMHQRLDPGTAGVTGFLVRLVTMAAMVLIALRLAGVELGTLAFGASFSAVIIGLAAQQTLGNILAGVVLLSARPFSVGERVRFVGGGVDDEGIVVSQGLLYVTIRDRADDILLPNTNVLSMAIRPIREPDAVEMTARLPQHVDPLTIEEKLREDIEVPTKQTPDVTLEALDEDVVVRIRAVPLKPADGPELSREVLHAVNRLRDAA